MIDWRLVVHRQMCGMVSAYGCYESLAREIAARWGRNVSAGTLSKKMHGVLDWTVADVIAIEDVMQRYPVTETLAKRRGGNVAAAGTLLESGSQIAKEAGEAVAALISASSDHGADPAALSDAVRELMEARAALREGQAKLEALMDAQGGGA